MKFLVHARLPRRIAYWAQPSVQVRTSAQCLLDAACLLRHETQGEGGFGFMVLVISVATNFYVAPSGNLEAGNGSQVLAASFG
jgi:hypothetical protein